MALDLLAIISAAGTGAITGYLTNNLALKMIFKEYGPLGGVVIKTKDEFIDSISALVERDLINHHTLKEEFSHPNFKKEFSRTVDDFINNHLENHSSKTLISDIPAWEDNLEILTEGAAEAIVELLGVSSEQLKDVELNKLIADSDQKKITAEIYSRILKKLESEAVVEKLVIEFYQQLQNKELKELLNVESRKQLKNTIKKLNENFKNNYQKLNQLEKNDFKEKTKELLNLEDFSKDIINEIKKIRINDLLKSKTEIEKAKDKAKIRKILKEMLVNIKIELNNSDFILADFLTEDLEAELKAEVEKIISAGDSELLNFLTEEENELNSLIFEAVEAEIEASAGFKAMSRQGIYSKYQENIDEYALPTTYLIDYLRDNLNADKQKITEFFFSKIKKIKINKLVSKIEIKELTNNLETLIWDFYQQNKDKRLIELFSEDFFAQDYFSNKIMDLLFSLIKKLSEESESIDIMVDYVFNFRVKDLITETAVNNKKEIAAANFYKFMQEENVIQAQTAAYLNQNFFAILNSEVNNSKAKFKNLIQRSFSNLKTTLSAEEISSFYRVFRDNPEAVADLTESISTFFYNNLPELLEGKIAEAASTNLHKLSDQEVQAAIEDFMGKELKPITYLGALLGAAAGLIFAASGAETAIFNASPVWVDYLSSAVLYGGVGWLTNVLAIWMIFHPYQQKKLAGFKLPFTPGIVAKNRSRFANSMGRFVEKELLKANSAAEIIEQNHSQISARTVEFFEENDYQQFFDLITENNQILAETILNSLKSTISELDQQSFESAAAAFNQELNLLFKEKAGDFDFAFEFTKYLKEDNDFLNLESRLSSNFKTEKIIEAAAGEYNLEFSSKELKNFMQNKELYPIVKFLVPYLFEREIDFDLKQYLINIAKEEADHYLDQGRSLFLEQQEKTARLINFKKDEIIEKEKEKKGGLLKNTLISGALYMADLDEFIDSVVARVFKQLEDEYFIENRSKLESIYFSFINKIENKELMTKDSLKTNQILKRFLNTEAGSELLTEALYLNEDLLTDLIDLTFKSENKKLFSLNLSIESELVEFFINEHLNLEQKLEILIQFKKLISTDNIKKELGQLIRQLDFGLLNQELKKIFGGLKLLDAGYFDAEFLAKFKENSSSLLDNQKLRRSLLSQLEAEISKVTETLKIEMNRDSLRYLLTLVIEAGIDSFKTNSEALLSSLELKELTAKEIRKMNPAEIENIFDSFAGEYFNHLKQYGWFGGVFGVLQLLLRTVI
jgi:uncharacterized membrane protein YheB (UPF0754 family)